MNASWSTSSGSARYSSSVSSKRWRKVSKSLTRTWNKWKLTPSLDTSGLRVTSTAQLLKVTAWPTWPPAGWWSLPSFKFSLTLTDSGVASLAVLIGIAQEASRKPASTPTSSAIGTGLSWCTCSEVSLATIRLSAHSLTSPWDCTSCSTLTTASNTTRATKSETWMLY